jgi:prepilin-type N-terminal cleavage/methylation domain-containing protein
MSLSFKTKSKNGFTLIELLVVISIIGLLASVIFVAVNGARKKARNARRVADMKQIATAFSEALNNSGATLPDSAGSWACISTSCYGSFTYSAVPAVDAFFSPFINKASDPSDNTRGAGGYLYNSAWAGGPSGYDGVFTAGPYLDWWLEPPYKTGDCGPGRAWAVDSVHTACMLLLNQ